MKYHITLSRLLVVAGFVKIKLLCVPKKEKNEIIVADFFGGSFSTMEAVYNLGFSGITCEIDREYYEKGLKRIKEITNQQKLF